MGTEQKFKMTFTTVNKGLAKTGTTQVTSTFVWLFDCSNWLDEFQISVLRQALTLVAKQS
jgi:hypothetical protein